MKISPLYCKHLWFGFSPALIPGLHAICELIYYRNSAKQKYIEAEEIKNDVLTRRILGDNHTCRRMDIDLTDEKKYTASAQGSNLFGYATVHMSKNNFEIDHGIKAHELCHIKHSDGLCSIFVNGMSWISTTYVINATLREILNRHISPSKNISCVGWKLLRAGISIKIGYEVSDKLTEYYSRYQEKRADLEGFSYCSKEEQARLIQSFRNDQQHEAQERQVILKLRQSLEAALLKAGQDHESQMVFRNALDKCNCSLKKRAVNGDDLDDKDHPPLSERIFYLEEAFRKQHGEEPPIMYLNREIDKKRAQERESLILDYL